MTRNALAELDPTTYYLLPTTTAITFLLLHGSGNHIQRPRGHNNVQSIVHHGQHRQFYFEIYTKQTVYGDGYVEGFVDCYGQWSAVSMISRHMYYDCRVYWCFSCAASGDR